MGSTPAILSLLAILLHHGEAIRCFTCSSQRDPNCKDPFISSQHDHNMLTHCSQDNMRNIGDTIPGIYSNFGYNTQPEDFVCIKAVTREFDREVVVRSCSIPRADSFDVCNQLKSRDLSFCQSCSSDSCNGAGGLAPLAILSIAPVLALLAVKY